MDLTSEMPLVVRERFYNGEAGSLLRGSSKCSSGEFGALDNRVEADLSDSGRDLDLSDPRSFSRTRRVLLSPAGKQQQT